MISTQGFHRRAGSDGWRVVAGGPTVHYPTGTYAAGAALVQAIIGLGTAGGHLVTDRFPPHWWVLADAEGNEACVAPIGWEGEVPTFGGP